MQIHTKVASTLLAVGLCVITIYKFIQHDLEDLRYADASDARATKGTITIGVDNWVGYYPLCSKEMQRTLRQHGYLLECIDDQANYAQRIKHLDQGRIDLAVATVDSYLINGKQHNFPGTIIAVIDESKGGDAIVANSNSITSIDQLKAAQNINIGLTANSPSEHLLRAVTSHFDIRAIKQNQLAVTQTDGSSEALSLLQSGSIDVAVLWEPDVSTALNNPEFNQLISSADTQRLIVDVLLASHQFSQQSPDLLNLVLSSYFHTLKYYRDRPDVLTQELTRKTNLSDSQVMAMLNGVAWAGLHQNSQHWLAGKHMLVETIESSLTIFKDFPAIENNLLPNNDPYRLINSRPLLEVQQEMGQKMAMDQPQQPTFTPLSEQQWQSMVEVGTLKTRNIVFSSGSNLLSEAGRIQLADAAESIKHYPNFRIKVEGHTGTRGDKAQNLQLSQQRAQAVRNYLIDELGFEQHRILAQGKGGSEPLVKHAGESNRRYASRLKRVEIALLSESY